MHAVVVEVPDQHPVYHCGSFGTPPDPGASGRRVLGCARTAADATMVLLGKWYAQPGKIMTSPCSPGAAAAGMATPAPLLLRHHRTPASRRAIRRLDDRMAVRVIEFMWAHLSDDLTLTTIAATACTSRFHFGRMFRETFERTTMQYLLMMRISAARAMLAEGGYSVAQVATHLGFCDQSHLCRSFRRLVGMAPGEFARTKGRSALADPLAADLAECRAPWVALRAIVSDLAGAAVHEQLNAADVRGII